VEGASPLRRQCYPAIGRVSDHDIETAAILGSKLKAVMHFHHFRQRTSRRIHHVLERQLKTGLREPGSERINIEAPQTFAELLEDKDGISPP
jgi:hypothetical protein